MKRCRLCYSQTDPKLSQNIFDRQLEPPIWRIIKQLSNLTIKQTDPYTKLVCSQCFHQLTKINTFQQMIVETDYRIRNENEQVSENTGSKGGNFGICSTPIKPEIIDCIVKEEQIEVEEDDPLQIENGTVGDYSKDDELSDNINSKSHTIFTDNTIDFCNSIKSDRKNCKNVEDDDNLDFGSINIETKNKTIRQKLKNTNNNHRCDTCNKTFEKKSYLIAHSRIHTGERPYQCKVCNKTFARSNVLQRHIKIHTADKQYSCSYCIRKFTENCILQRHLRIHTGEKPYQCDICKKGFAEKYNLKVHLRVHTDERPYQCKFCEKGFTEKYNLIVHLRVHTGETPFHCNICNRKYARQSSLKVHLTTHTKKKIVSV